MNYLDSLQTHVITLSKFLKKAVDKGDANAGKNATLGWIAILSKIQCSPLLILLVWI